MNGWFGKISVLLGALSWGIFSAAACGQEGNVVTGATAASGTTGAASGTSSSTGGGGGGGGGTTSSGGGGTPEGCFDYTGFDGATPVVSFQSDVLPIFQKSCGLSSACHGVENGVKPGQHYLGPKNGTTATQGQIDSIFAENVDATAVKEPSMKVIAPGDPERSFILHKVDDTLDCALLTCEGTACGGSMPLGSEAIEATSRDTLRRWIAQGAQNN